MEKSTKRFRKERRGQRGKCIGNNNDRQRVICRVREIKVKLGFVTGSVSLFNLRDRLSEPSFVNWNIEILWDSFSFFFLLNIALNNCVDPRDFERGFLFSIYGGVDSIN